MFIDKCIIELKAGNGGDGIVAWRREAHYPEGGPWGGNGGNGGDIYVEGDHNQNSLFELRYIKKIAAEDGHKGGSKLCHGASGNDHIIKVPLGTIIKDVETNELISDITIHGQKILICKGGKGGYGNAHFKSSYNKTPKLFERGDIGEKKKVFLEIKYLSDVGILGLPNAGKSTLISKISMAKPKIAPYKFTTINPILGSVEYENDKLIFADIPGLIEGAASGVGLGLEFLKHVERCTILIHLISGSKMDNESSIEAYQTILNEVKKYDLNIQKKKMFIAISKQDEESFDELYEEISKFLPNEKIYKVNCLNEFPQELIHDIFVEYKNNLIQLAKLSENEVENSRLVIKMEKQEEDILEIIEIEKGIWEAKSSAITYWINKIPLINDDNLIRFNQKINLPEIEQKIKKQGGKIGDTIIIGENQFVIE